MPCVKGKCTSPWTRKVDRGMVTDYCYGPADMAGQRDEFYCPITSRGGKRNRSTRRQRNNKTRKTTRRR